VVSTGLTFSASAQGWIWCDCRQCEYGREYQYCRLTRQYVGGSALYFPVDASGALSKESDSPNLVFPFAYEGQKAPNPERQDASHIHHVVETADGKFYIADLGSDKVWVVMREGESGLAIKGYLQAPPGAGPRHLALSPDGKSTSATSLTS
jgi:6-phosphogluconolactonase (cycloisomerase 2 family)